VRLLLDLLYGGVLLAGLPCFLWQALRNGKYRAGYGQKFLGLAPRRDVQQHCLWLHAVSVGEVNLLAPLVDRIAQQWPDWQCVLSTTTAAGMAVARKKYPHLSVFYCPLDFSWATARAMRRIRPNLLVLAELELWPNLISAARRHGAKVAVVNGRLSQRSYCGYRLIRPLAAQMLRQIDLIAAQDQTYAERFRALGARPECVHVTGSMKYDGAQTDRNNPATARLKRLAGLDDDDIVLLAGSTQVEEEIAVLEVFRRLSADYRRLRLIIVPRHPQRFEAVARWLDDSGYRWQRRSRLEADGADRNARVLLVDTVGELSAWWGVAQIALVGGSFGKRGGQNMIEPAAYGAAVCFGPNTWNFRDVVAAMLAADAAVVVHDADELADFVQRCLDCPHYAAQLGRRAQALVQSQLGATDRTVQLLAELIPARGTGNDELRAAAA